MSGSWSTRLANGASWIERGRVQQGRSVGESGDRGLDRWEVLVELCDIAERPLVDIGRVVQDRRDLVES